MYVINMNSYRLLFIHNFFFMFKCEYIICIMLNFLLLCLFSPYSAICCLKMIINYLRLQLYLFINKTTNAKKEKKNKVRRGKQALNTDIPAHFPFKAIRSRAYECYLIIRKCIINITHTPLMQITKLLYSYAGTIFF